MAVARTVAAVIAAGAILTGCSGTALTTTPSPPGEDFAALAQSALEDARASGATEAQLALIERAVALGEVTFADVDEAVQGTFACFESAGVRYQVLAPRNDQGVLYPSYTFEGGDKTAAADECIHTNSDFVEVLYMRQPIATEARDAAFAAAMPALVECLRGLGHELDEDITADELKEWFRLEAVEMSTAQSNEAYQDTFRCVGKAGIDGW